jgi:hypothetical protein
LTASSWLAAHAGTLAGTCCPAFAPAANPTDAIYQRFVVIEGSAYFVGGLGMTAPSFNNIAVFHVRSGVGLRLGADVGYFNFAPTWNPL